MTAPDRRAPLVEQDAVENAAAQLLIELAFLLPTGTDVRAVVGPRLTAYKEAIEKRCALTASVSTTQVQALVEQWKAQAAGVIDDVNNGNAPAHEADTARGWLQCADDLTRLMIAEPQNSKGAPSLPTIAWAVAGFSLPISTSREPR